MGARISTIQRQARELGRLRTGTYDPTGKGKPQRSSTWIITSPHEAQIQAAAELYGGEFEKWQPQGAGAPQFRVITETAVIEALLPPGDPVSQTYETWSKGGVQRRCDGTSESVNNCPCICRATWGDEFHLTAPRDAACKMTTRLNVILPQMPDMGVFRVETHSFYSANEIAASVDIIRAAVGPEQLVPVNLRIDPRTKVAKGQTKKFPVVVVELRGVRAEQVLASLMYGAKAIEGGSRTAIEGGRPDYEALAKDATSLEEWRGIWNQAYAAGHLDPGLKDVLAPLGKALSEQEQASRPADADEAEARAALDDSRAAQAVHEHPGAFDSDCPACQEEQRAIDLELADGDER